MKSSFLKLRKFSGIKYFQCRRVSQIVELQNEIFDAERSRQHNSIGRIEKIEVKYLGNPTPCKLFMNKFISTPYNIAQHMNEWVVERSGLALLNKEQVWDMHRPLEGDCEVELLSFTDPDPYHINKAFWRTCSFVLGAVIKNAFNSNVEVHLHSFPSPQIASGSFIHDAELILESEWVPSLDELRSLSASALRLAQKNLPLERLEVDSDTASRIFQDNRFKLQQIPSISSQSGGKVILYRAGTHIDISKGPMVGNTSFIGRCSIASVHQIEKDGQKLYRFQGVALPRGILLNHFAYRLLEERASKLNNQVSTSYIERKFEEMAQ